MKIVVDTREQISFTFKNERYENVEVIRKGLFIGDYSLDGFEEHCAVERKSLPDLIASISHERERFCRELQRGQSLDSFMVVVEAPLKDIANGTYRSKMNAHAAVQSIVSMQQRYKVPFVFADSVALAEYYTYSFFSQFLKRKQAEYKNLFGKHSAQRTETATDSTEMEKTSTS